MQVKVDMTSVDICLGNNGIVLKIADEQGNHQGSLRIGQATVEWRKGRTHKGNGKALELKKLLAYLDDM